MNRNRTTPEPSFVSLSEAYLCCDCEAIGNSAMRCPRCESKALMAVVQALPRHRDSIRILCKPVEEEAEVPRAA